MPSFLRRFAACLVASIPRVLTSARLVATLYLLAIPMFASIYSLMWRDFHQSTALSDPTFAVVRQSTYDSLVGIASDWLPQQVAGRALECHELKDFRTSPTGESIEATQLVVLRRSDGADGYGLQWSIDLSPTEDGMSDQFPVFVDGIPIPIAKPLAYVRDANGVLLFKRHRRQGFDGFFWAPLTDTPNGRPTGFFEGTWRASHHVATLLRDYAATLHGSPAPVRFGFGRYLYLSVVTITTLGFGDMVPLTDRGRLLIAIEAIVGVLLAGLFLNALAVKITSAK